MDYVVSTMHMQGFSRMFRPANYAPTEADHDKVKARGKEIMEKGLALMDKALEGKEYVAGKFSVADAALFYVEFWAAAPHEDAAAQELRRPLRAHEEPPGREAHDRAGRPHRGRLSISRRGSPRRRCLRGGSRARRR